MPNHRRLPWRWTLALGLGPSADFDDERASRAIRKMLQTMRGLELAKLAVALPGREIERIPARRALQVFLKEAEAAPAGSIAEVTLVETPPVRRISARCCAAAASRAAPRAARAWCELGCIPAESRRLAPHASSRDGRGDRSLNFAHAPRRTKMGAMAPSFDVAVQQFLDHLRVERELAPATVSAYGGDLCRLREVHCRARRPHGA